MILERILKQIYKVFENKYQVYTEKQSQGVSLPAFFVTLVNSELEPHFSNRYYLRNLISITFMSDTNDMLLLENMRFKMIFALEEIHAKNIAVQISDGSIVLHCQYNIELEREELETYMASLQSDWRIKENG